MKLTNNIETFLQSPKGLKKSWIRTILTMVLCLTLLIIIIVLSFTYGPLSGKSEYVSMGKSFYQVVNAPYLEASTWISVAALCLTSVPFIYLFSVWMIGINQVSSSKRFHLFMWIITFIVVILSIIALILFIRSSLYSLNSEYLKIGSTDSGDTGTGDSGTGGTTQSLIIKAVSTLSNLMN